MFLELEISAFPWKVFFKQKNNSFPDVEDEDLSRAVEIHSIGSLNNADALYSDHQQLSSIFQNDDDDDDDGGGSGGDGGGDYDAQLFCRCMKIVAK